MGGVETQGGAVRAGSTADGGRHACSELVICAGPWSGHVLRLVDGLDPRWAPPLGKFFIWLTQQSATGVRKQVRKN